MNELQDTIEQAFTQTSHPLSKQAQQAIYQVIEQLNQGTLRVAEKQNGQWIVHQWVKKAVLLYFRLQQNTLLKSNIGNFYDKVPLKFAHFDETNFQRQGARIVPPATVRTGTYIGPKAILMPSYINIGAYIGAGTMVDTWATVGSCAQIGKNVHLSGGVGIGGVLEPLQANPTIVEDNCFIGARSEVVEGVIVEEGVVLSMGVYVGQSTKIYDRQTGEIFYGRIPAYSVVVPGTLPSGDNKYNLYAAIIVKKVDEKTRARVGINEILREAQAQSHETQTAI